MHAERGLTLLELLVVLAIFGLVSGLAAMAYAGRSSREADRISNRLDLLLRTARREAIDSGQVVSVILGSGAVSLQGVRTLTTLRSPAQMHLRWTSSVGTRHEGPTFYPDGSAGPGTLDVDIAGRRSRVEVDWFGGMRNVDLHR